MKKICLIGWHGKFNLGDDIMLDVISWGAKNFWGAEEIRVWAQEGTFSKIKEGTTVKGIFKKGYWYNLFSRLHSLWWADTLIFGGGSIFHSRNGIKRKYLIVFIFDLLKFFNKEAKRGALGVSLGPFKEYEDMLWCKKLLRKCDFITVRDKESYELLKEMGFKKKAIFSFDLAALSDNVYNIQKGSSSETNEPYIGIAVADCDKFKGRSPELDQLRVKKIAETIKYVLSKKKVKIKLFALCTDSIFGDLHVIKDIYSNLKEEEQNCLVMVPYHNNPKEIIMQLSECEVILSMKLHGSILAYLLDKKLIMLDYHAKCTAFAKYIGLDDKYRFDYNKFEPEKLGNTLINVLTTYEKFSLLSKEEAKRLCFLNFSEL